MNKNKKLNYITCFVVLYGFYGFYNVALLIWHCKEKLRSMSMSAFLLDFLLDIALPAAVVTIWAFVEPKLRQFEENANGEREEKQQQA